MKPRFKFDADWKEALRLLGDCNHPSQIRINFRLALPRPLPHAPTRKFPHREYFDSVMHHGKIPHGEHRGHKGLVELHRI